MEHVFKGDMPAHMAFVALPRNVSSPPDLGIRFCAQWNVLFYARVRLPSPASLAGQYLDRWDVALGVMDQSLESNSWFPHSLPGPWPLCM